MVHPTQYVIKFSVNYRIQRLFIVIWVSSANKKKSGPDATKLFLCWANIFCSNLCSQSIKFEYNVFPYLRIFSDLSKFSSFVAPGPELYNLSELLLKMVFSNLIFESYPFCFLNKVFISSITGNFEFYDKWHHCIFMSNRSCFSLMIPVVCLEKPLDKRVETDL